MTDAALYIPPRTKAERLRNAIRQVTCARESIAAICGLENAKFDLRMAVIEMRDRLRGLDELLDQQEGISE